MGNLNRCVIVGGGECSPKFLKENIKCGDFIVCADSGYDIVKECGIIPDLLIGDFDSIKTVPKNVEIITLPVEKDVTDCEATFNECVNRGFKKFVLFGGTGGRFEHTFANLSVMARAVKDGFNFEIFDEKHIFRCVSNSSLKIQKKNNKQISVFAFGSKAYGVTEKGFHYPLNKYTLDPFVPLGISNDIVDEFGEITVENGTLIVIETFV